MAAFVIQGASLWQHLIILFGQKLGKTLLLCTCACVHVVCMYIYRTFACLHVAGLGSRNA